MNTTDLIQIFTIDLPQDDVQYAIRRKIENLNAQPQKGFRAPEYMPLSYILKKFGEEFISEILRELLTNRVNAEISSHGWDVAFTNIVGKWKVNDRPLRYLYEIHLELYPTFEVKGLDTLQIRAPSPTVVDDAHINAALEALRRGNSEWNFVDRPSQKGDRVTINFSSLLSDGSPFPGGTNDNVGVELGAGGMLPEFEEQLTGVTAGQKLDFSVSFPADYGTPVLRDKTAFFSVKILSVSKFDLIPMDDTFPKKCKFEGTLEELRQATRVHLQRQHDEQDQCDADSDLLRQLAVANAVSLPPSLVAQNLEVLQLETMVQRNETAEQILSDDGILERVQYRVHLSVVVRQLIKQEKLEFSNDRDLTEQVVEWLRKRAAQNAMPTEQQS